MGEYASTLVDRLIQRAGAVTLDEAVDLYQAHAARALRYGPQGQREAVAQAHRAAVVAGLEQEYEQARQAAVGAWRRSLPAVQGPWLFVGQAIANAAGACVVAERLDDEPFQILIGPWRQAMGSLTPVGPGIGSRQLTPSR